jgi:hypothetical protein
MRGGGSSGHSRLDSPRKEADMSQTTEVPVAAPPAPPYSRQIRVAAGACLVLGGLTNGLVQYVQHLVVPEGTVAEEVRWGLDHSLYLHAEQTLVVLSALFMPLALLGVAQVTRWRSPRLTVVALPLLLWGMWGFHNILSTDYLVRTVAPGVIPTSAVAALDDVLVSDTGLLVTALLPHLVGSLFGALLLSVAAWRSGAFSRVACGFVIAFLAWDFFVPPVGPFEAHLLLTVGWVWWGIDLIRMPHRLWAGGRTA